MKLEAMSHRELTELKGRIDRLIPKKKREAIEELRATMDGIAREHGMRLTDVVANGK